APDAAALADELLQLEVEVASLRGLAIEELSELPTDRGVAAHRSIVQLQRGRMPSMIAELEGQSVALRTLRERDAARTQKLAEFEQAFAAAAARTAEVVCAVGQDPRFREA